MASPFPSRVLLAVAPAVADPLRGWAYAGALTPPEDDDEAARLLRYLGRDPGWSA